MDAENERGLSSGGQKVIEELGDDEKPTFQTRQYFNAPISRLPNEILVQIFTIYKTSFCTVSWDDTTLIRPWHGVTHVCRYWRHVALNAANLWVELPTGLHDYTLLMLERSRQSTISAHLHAGVSKATRAAVLKHVRRIRRLVLASPKDGLDELQETLLELDHGSFSQLRELFLYGSLGTSNDPFKLSTSTFRHASSLKMLGLGSIDFDWQLFPISSLTHLHLSEVCVSVSPSWRQFQDILRGMPSLENLLFGFDDLRIYAPPNHVEPLELPSLSKLELLSSHPLVTQAFIYNTRLSRRLQRALFACSFNDLDIPPDYSPTIRAVLSLHDAGDFVRFKTLSISKNPFWDGQELYLRVTVNCHPAATAQDSARLPSSIMTDIASIETSSNPVSDIVHLSLSVDLSSHDLMTLFGGLPHLQKITIASVSSSPLIRSLNISPLHPADSPIPFAKLNAVILDDRRTASGCSPALLNELIDCLMMRCEYGAGVEYLSTSWKLTSDQARRLREIVVHVDVQVEGYGG